MYTYAGIGSRKTPLAVQKEMTKAAEFLQRRNWVLRSGGAQGADTAFEKGVSVDWGKKIYHPTHVFTSQHYEIAAAHHPAWNKLVPYVKQLHARNVAILLGDDCKSPCVRHLLGSQPNIRREPFPKVLCGRHRAGCTDCV